MQINDFRLERYFAKHEFSAPYLLCTSDCESLTVNDLLKLEENAEANLKNLWLGYTESAGSKSLRTEISRLYKDISPDHILVHSGAEEAIFNFMNSLLKKGDHLIVHYPCYQSLTEIAESIGCEITYWQTREEDCWQLDTSFLKNNIRSNTKGVVINSPHNPTGYSLSQEELDVINEIASDNNLIVFSDEVYRGLEYNRITPSAFCDMNEMGVSLGVMSKSFGLAGLRIGWIASRNKSLLNRMTSFKDYTTICNSAPSEFLAEVALKNRNRIVNRNLEIIQSNISLLDNFFDLHSDKLSWVKPNAGPIAFPSFRGGKSADQICAGLLETKGVLLLPGSLYDDQYKMNFRLGLGRKNLPQALERFGDFLSTFND